MIASSLSAPILDRALAYWWPNEGPNCSNDGKMNLLLLDGRDSDIGLRKPLGRLSSRPYPRPPPVMLDLARDLDAAE